VLQIKALLFLVHPLHLHMLQLLYRPVDSFKTASEEENDWWQQQSDPKLSDFHCKLCCLWAS